MADAVLSAATLLFYLWFAVELFRGRSSVLRLRELPPTKRFPKVSIVVAARNEERKIREGLASLLAQDYPGLEVVAVDDRSEDATGAILDAMAADDACLRVIHVRELPDGWLGKNHALWTGAREAAGEILLFTDADVVMAPDAVSRGVGRLLASGAAHVAVGPEIETRGIVLDALIGAFTIFFTLYARPWQIRNPRSGAHIGIGAFNLITAEDYRRIGTHEAIRLRPDDDMKLGKLVKRHGLRQELVSGMGMLRVEWYATVPEMVRGLEKNSFAGVEYRLAPLVGGTLLALVCFVRPFAAVFLETGLPAALDAAAILLAAAIYGYCSRLYGIRFRLFPLFPAAVLLFLFTVWRAAILTLVRGGIEWRGTRYPLDQLKRNRV